MGHINQNEDDDREIEVELTEIKEDKVPTVKIQTKPVLSTSSSWKPVFMYHLMHQT